MWPTLRPGSVVLGLRWLRPRVGDVVIARHANLEIIKRVQAISSQGVFLQGDNPEASTDSRRYGWLSFSAIESVVIRRNHDYKNTTNQTQ